MKAHLKRFGLRPVAGLIALLLLATLPAAMPPAPAEPDPASPLQAVVAPNPLRIGYNGTSPMLRLTTGGTGVTIGGITVFSLAGEEVRRIAASDLALPAGAFIAPNTTVTLPGWWDLQTSSGTLAASGVYWVHVVGHMDGSAAPVSSVQKLVVIR